ncbi:MAG: hypothetical protein AAB909_03855 [Patescibacteria group bacterium]
MRRFFLLTTLFLFLSVTQTQAQQFKCIKTPNCDPCTNWSTAANCLNTATNTNLCNTGVNPCTAFSASCPDNGSQLDQFQVQTCSTVLPACSSPNLCLSESACSNPVSGFSCGGNLICCAPPGEPTSTPVPTTAPTACETFSGPYNNPFVCMSPGGAVSGSYDCNPGGSSPLFDPTAPPNSYDNACGCAAATKSSCSLICCHSNSTVGPPGTTGVPPYQPSSLCVPPNGSTYTGVKTPFGCLPYTGADGPAKTTVVVLSNWAVAISSSIAIFIILFAALQIATGSGDPKRIKAGQELLFSGLAGLFLISLAIVVLNFLGVTILGLDLLGFFV